MGEHFISKTVPVGGHPDRPKGSGGRHHGGPREAGKYSGQEPHR
jgi:hypothetical protein